MARWYAKKTNKSPEENGMTAEMLQTGMLEAGRNVDLVDVVNKTMIAEEKMNC